ncbi:hypothetical protein PVW53_04455 [Seohaeicola sp. SP36]|uniref:hypothetical protein n=1 Tax=unclassified Seohaeicola TaxID=2641111 RepID=UPI00237AF068|nr:MULTISPECIES: hypothetical protein [unclassified Seohaeicola]MDD9707767.1 hypothetical protein [Seohaeicola sp. 4SK31]MDD9734763.1 hypothetical protein [Seohaeicola sp. SP36]
MTELEVPLVSYRDFVQLFMRTTMRDALYPRLAKLCQTDLPINSVQDFKVELFDVLKVCQVDPENEYLLRSMAHCLMRAAQVVFGSATLVLTLTEPRRRQVYFAVLAYLQKANQLYEIATNDVARQALLERLLMQSNEDLISGVYGSCPDGYLRLVTRIGEEAADPDFYLGLFTLLSEAPSLSQHIFNAVEGDLRDPLHREIVELIFQLPRTKQSVRLAKCFGTSSRFDNFMQLYSTITGNTIMSEEHSYRICIGESPARVINDVYLSIPFNDPVINMPAFHYVSNGYELLDVAQKFRNCLRDYVEQALKGDHQYYVWNKPGAREAIVSIVNDTPFGWRLSDARLADNKPVEYDHQAELFALVEKRGIRTTRSVRLMMRSYLDLGGDT